MSSFWLNVTVTLLFMMGLVMVYSATSADILDHGLDRSLTTTLLKQLAYGLCGALLALILYRTGYQKLLELSPILLAFFTLLLVLVLIPGIGKAVNGSRRWLMVAGVSLQPSEFVKYIVPLYLIHRYDPAKRWSWSLVGITLLPLFLILVEPNNGTVGVILVTILALFWLMQVPVKYWAVPLMVIACLVGIFASQLPYVSARLKVYMNPEEDLLGRGHQPYQAKVAAGAGQLLGRGPGNSLQKLSYLPEAQNDYIAAIYAEEYGFFGVIFLITLYMLVALMGFQIAYHCGDFRGVYLAGAITFLLTFQAFINLGVVSGLLPSTGLNLPWFSQGGSSLIANIAALGLLGSVSQNKNSELIRS